MAWWEPTTGSYTVVAAYQAVGAADAAASYVNLANPGTNNLSTTDAPAFDADTGWTFNGTSDNLTSGASTSNKPATYIVRMKGNGTSGYRTLIGGSNNGALSFYLEATTNNLLLQIMNVVAIGSSSSAPADATDAVVAVSYSGAGAYVFYIDGSSAGSGTNDQTPTAARTLRIGDQAPAGTLRYVGDILAVAMYSTALDATQVAEISANMAALANATEYQQALAGTLTSAGTLVKRTSKPLAGTLTSAGTVVKSTGKVLAGALTSAGAVVKRTGKTLAGVLTSAGVVTKRTGKALAGALTSSGTLATVFVAAAQGLIDLTARARSFALEAKERVFALTARSRE